MSFTAQLAIPLLLSVIVLLIGLHPWSRSRSRNRAVVPARVRDAFDTFTEGLLVIDENGLVVLANQSFCQSIAENPDALIGRSADRLGWIVHDNDWVTLPWSRAAQSQTPQTEQLLRFRTRGGETRCFSINATPIGAESDSPDASQPAPESDRGVLVSVRDVTRFETERAETERMLAMLRHSRAEISDQNAKLKDLASRDPLTGCLNRRALFESIEPVWQHAGLTASPIACLMVDNDHFKNVNDEFGHAIGDEVLRRVGQSLRDEFESDEPLDGDVAAPLISRYGGEEFCVFLPGHDCEAALTRAERLRVALTEIRLDEAPDLRLSASIGVSDTNRGATDPAVLIHQADKCLYAAKHRGRNVVVVIDDEIESMSIEQTCRVERRDGDAPPDDLIALPFQAVTALVSALAYRDADTAEHSRRVADLCVRAAGDLLDQRETYVLEVAALLHDIGKIGVPDQVLLKPGPLTGDQWVLMQNHERIGAEIVAGTFRCDALSDIIRSYQMFYGGRGSASVQLTASDEKSSGRDLPVSARLLAIADSYDSMVHDKIYRRGRSHDEAIAELRRCAGSQFDPLLVEHFASRIHEQDPTAFDASGKVPKPVAMQIGIQIERLAEAFDEQDIGALSALAGRLRQMAQRHGLDLIAEAARGLTDLVDSPSSRPIEVMRQTRLLMDLCRGTQNAFVVLGPVDT